MEYRTERLVLKPFTPNDTEAALDLLTNDIIKITYILPDFECRADALPLFHRLMQLSMDESHYVRGIYRKDCLIGFLNDVEIRNKSIELGYVIHPSHQGQGYMSEALRGAADDLFRTGFREIIAGAFEENAASIRVMEKCGMTRLDQTDEIEYRSAKHRCIYYSIKSEE